MKDQYTGDIGDFGKYGLLRSITTPNTEGDRRKLGVVWYLTPEEAGSRDGRHTGYLRAEDRQRRRFTTCDEALYQALAELVESGTRNVKAVQQSGILDPETVYYDKKLDLKGIRRSKGTNVRQERLQRRRSWHEGALEKTKECDVVFLDPDNGLETGRVQPDSAQGAKYAYYEELQSYSERGQSLVVYHHLNRGQSAAKQIHEKQRRIYRLMERRALVVRYHRGSPRAFILIPQDEHRQEFTDCARRMAAGPWKEHFTMVL